MNVSPTPRDMGRWGRCGGAGEGKKRGKAFARLTVALWFSSNIPNHKITRGSIRIELYNPALQLLAPNSRRKP